jgi:hypothetical protein
VHLGVATVGQSIQVATLPANQALESGIQCPGDGSNLTKPDLVQPSMLDQGNDSTRDSRSD